MTHEYKHKVDLHIYDHCSKCDDYMGSYIKCLNCGHIADVDSLLDYARELEERNKELEEKLSRYAKADADMNEALNSGDGSYKP